MKYHTATISIFMQVIKQSGNKNEYARLAISETQLINKGMENMHIRCIGVGVMGETLYQWFKRRPQSLHAF